MSVLFLAGSYRHNVGQKFSMITKMYFRLIFSFAPELVSYFAPRDLHRRAAYLICESSFLIHHGVYQDLFV